MLILECDFVFGSIVTAWELQAVDKEVLKTKIEEVSVRTAAIGNRKNPTHIEQCFILCFQVSVLTPTIPFPYCKRYVDNMIIN